MRSGILIFGLLLSCAANAATWKPLADGQGVQFFVDPDSRIRISSTVMVLVLSNYESPKIYKNHPYRSRVEYWRADCSGDKVALVDVHATTGDMGTGAIVFEESVNSPWVPIKAGNVSEALLHAACSN